MSQSVDLTFQDLAEMTQNVKAPEKKKPTTMEPISEAKTPIKGSHLTKIPSLDFSIGLQEAKLANHDHHHRLDHTAAGDLYRGHDRDHDHDHHSHATRAHGHRYVKGEESHRNHASPDHDHRSGCGINAYDDVSGMSSMATSSMYQERGGRRRPGIPHSNICMGEMTEGRKCIECLGRRFSQRYIQRAGQVRCCRRYPSMVKLAELKWAEKGPRKSGERAYGQGRSGMSMMSTGLRSPMTPRAHARSWHYPTLFCHGLALLPLCYPTSSPPPPFLTRPLFYLPNS
ncbi:hypothetical protein FH972_011830 [Carpinus fangiana]|uniref:Uncharacterized protein n=1 Tax=Carpinus fangiana TaxID=176857 RepID=A0A660KVK7_9ROSI|nr:hypothetical protein FH972_011830 [Carpinus fangiana]